MPLWKALSTRTLALVVAVCPVYAVGFDCSKAKTEVEHLICGNSELNELDRSLNRLYRNITMNPEKPVAQVQAQRNWLSSVRDRCKSVGCLKAAYRRRIEALTQQMATSAGQPSGDPNCGLPASRPLNAACEARSVCAINGDRSITQAVVDYCGDEPSRPIRVYFYAGLHQKPVLLDELDPEDVRDVSFGEPDRHGYAELDITEMCGAGPNCWHSLYRIDPKTKQLYPYFSGGYSQLIYLDGYLVGSGRASCCSWEYHAYPIKRVGDRDVIADQSLTVTVSATGDDETETPVCRFYRADPKSGSNGVSVRPPNKKWLSLCEVYGKYQVR